MTQLEGITGTTTINARAARLLFACLMFASVTICTHTSAATVTAISGAPSLHEHTLTSTQPIQQQKQQHPIATTTENRIIPDAPKFYHLNELLYKTTNGNESPQAVALPNLRPLMDGAHLAPRSMKAAANDADDGDTANANEDDSPIDGMVTAMKRGRGGPQESSFMGGEAADGAAANRDGSGGGGLMRGQAGARNNIGPDDDATIQRKSTNLDDDSVDEQPPARLRARDRAPRRRRRASMRQAPPKLKSRRVSRNSRRRKLRHGIKPRRRA